MSEPQHSREMCSESPIVEAGPAPATPSPADAARQSVPVIHVPDDAVADSIHGLTLAATQHQRPGPTDSRDLSGVADPAGQAGRTRLA